MRAAARTSFCKLSWRHRRSTPAKQFPHPIWQAGQRSNRATTRRITLGWRWRFDLFVMPWLFEIVIMKLLFDSEAIPSSLAVYAQVSTLWPHVFQPLQTLLYKFRIFRDLHFFVSEGCHMSLAIDSFQRDLQLSYEQLLWMMYWSTFLSLVQKYIVQLEDAKKC